MDVLWMYYGCIMDLFNSVIYYKCLILVEWHEKTFENMSREKVKIPLPNWWIGKHGSEFLMPNMNPTRTLTDINHLSYGYRKFAIP
jgi:hypothetical protein